MIDHEQWILIITLFKARSKYSISVKYDKMVIECVIISFIINQIHEFKTKYCRITVFKLFEPILVRVTIQFYSRLGH